uniref:ADP-ribosylation factor-like 9 n=1 Tax=Periophthalmus magnuspinnatus TaxID=409849 RepID=A0A3B4ARY2_9GOBI
MVGFRDVGALGASVVIAGGVAYFVWNYLSKQKTSQPPAKEAEKPTEESIKPIKQDGDGDVKAEEIRPVSAPVVATEASVQSTAVVKTVKPRGTQVLVLGLDGAGKTSLLRSFTNSWSGEEPQRTQGLNAVSISREDLAIEFLEIGGSAELRQYWLKYMSKALMLVYVVDASNPQVFPLAKTHLHEILATEPHLPLMVLANKQDCAGACTITDLHEALSLSQLGDRKLFVIGTYVTKDVEEPSSGVEDALEIIIETIQTQR